MKLTGSEKPSITNIGLRIWIAVSISGDLNKIHPMQTTVIVKNQPMIPQSRDLFVVDKIIRTKWFTEITTPWNRPQIMKVHAAPNARRILIGRSKNPPNPFGSYFLVIVSGICCGNTSGVRPLLVSILGSSGQQYDIPWI